MRSARMHSLLASTGCRVRPEVVNPMFARPTRAEWNENRAPLQVAREANPAVANGRGHLNRRPVVDRYVRDALRATVSYAVAIPMRHGQPLQVAASVRGQRERKVSVALQIAKANADAAMDMCRRKGGPTKGDDLVVHENGRTNSTLAERRAHEALLK